MLQELKDMFDKFVAILEDLFSVLEGFIADIKDNGSQPWEDDEWATKA